MALGETYNNNKEKNKPSVTVYSPYKMGNSESQVDPTMFYPTFWNNLLKLSIAPLKPSKTGEVSYDYDNAISAYLNHTKARMLHDEIVLFQSNPDAYNNHGVAAGQGLISISNGKEFGVTSPCIVIRKINPENGQIESSFAYQFKTEYHYSIRNFDAKTNDFDKIYHAGIEIEELKTLLIQYYTAMTGAIAYSVIEQSKYDNSRFNTKLEMIAEKLGIEFGKGGGKYNTNKSSNSIFNNKEPRSFSSSTIDDISNQMED